MDQRQAGNLSTLRRVHICGKHKCKQCGKCYSQAENLRRHKRVHTGEKPYKCKQCGKCFSEAGNLREHERVHTGEKPHECKQCGKCFSEAGNLRTHERVHTGERPYECKQCGRCFSQSQHLRKHGRVHSGEKSYRFSSQLRRLRRHKNARKDTANCSRDNVMPQTPILLNVQSDLRQKHICWICQEELSSEALLLEHYENHMTCD